jgi:hypothetical protein
MKATCKTIAAILAASVVAAATPASAGNLLGELLFGSLDSAQSDCYAQNPGRYLDTWRCVRARIAQGHTGDMRNGPALKYMAIGDMLYASVKARRMDDATALYKLAAALTAGDIEYRAIQPPDVSVTCNSFGRTTICN